MKTRALFSLVLMILILSACQTEAELREELNTGDRAIFQAGLIEADQPILDQLPGASYYHIDLKISDDTIVSSLISAGKHMAGELGIAASGYKLVFNVERGGGQMIFHLHLHLLGGWKR